MFSKLKVLMYWKKSYKMKRMAQNSNQKVQLLLIHSCLSSTWKK